MMTKEQMDSDDALLIWIQRLKQALKSGDVMYAMECDKMIYKLKRA